MTRRPRTLATFLGAALSLSLLAAACGDDGDTTATGNTTDPGSEGGGSDDRADWPEKLVFAAVPAEESTSLESSYGPIIEILELELGLEVEFFQATDYAGVIEAQVAGRVDMAQYGPFSYVIAKNNGADILPAGAMIGAPDEEPGYTSYGIANPDAGIDSIEDFEGKRVCFVDPGSTSGFLYPAQGLISVGIDPEDDVNATFAGGHDAAVISVANGDCDAGFAFDAMVDTIVIENGDIEDGDVVKVWESEVIAGSPLAVRQDLPASLVAEINRIIVELANDDYLNEVGICDGPCELTDENVWGFAKVEDDFYDGVRAVCEATRAEACEG